MFHKNKIQIIKFCPRACSTLFLQDFRAFSVVSKLNHILKHVCMQKTPPLQNGKLTAAGLLTAITSTYQSEDPNKRTDNPDSWEMKYVV